MVALFLAKPHLNSTPEGQDAHQETTTPIVLHESESASHSVVSDSLRPRGLLAHQAPLSMGIPQARILE